MGSDGGDDACWLDRVCDRCGALVDGPDHACRLPALGRAVRRGGDGELCGYVERAGGGWDARTVFGGQLGHHDDPDAAEHQVRAEGLAALAERWTLVDVATGDEQVVCIQEARPGTVVVALGFYALPGVPTRTLAGDDLGQRWRLERR